MTEIDYPEHHRAIVTALYREGRFLLEGERAFVVLKEQPDFYRSFFSSSFGLELYVQRDYALLRSSRDQDDFSRSVCIFLAILSYELDQETDNLLQALETSFFSIADWEDRFPRSSYYHIMEATKKLQDASARENFYKDLDRRSLIRRDGDLFQFTPAHRYFLDWARGMHLAIELQATTNE